MIIQIISCILSTGLTYVFVIELKLDVIGAGIVISLCNVFVLIGVLLLTKWDEDLKEANEAEFRDPLVIKQVKLLLSYGLPSLAIIMLDWFCDQTMALTSGCFGVN